MCALCDHSDYEWKSSGQELWYLGIEMHLGPGQPHLGCTLNQARSLRWRHHHLRVFLWPSIPRREERVHLSHAAWHSMPNVLMTGESRRCEVNFQ